MKWSFVCMSLVMLAAGASAQTWTPTFDSLARITEQTYSLPHGICRAFALQESTYNPNALRAEGNYITKNTAFARSIRARAIAFAKAHKYSPSILTEIVQRGESHTMWQIMGENLRQMGLDTPFIAGTISLTDQFKYFALFIGALLQKHHGNIAYAASEYNGGVGAINNGTFRNAPYVKNILRNLRSFSY